MSKRQPMVFENLHFEALKIQGHPDGAYTAISRLDSQYWTKTVVAKSRPTMKFSKLNNFKIFDFFWISKIISILAHFEIFTVQFYPCPGCLLRTPNSRTFTKKVRKRPIGKKMTGDLYWPSIIYFKNLILLPKQTFLNEHLNGISCVLLNMFHLRIF